MMANAAKMSDIDFQPNEIFKSPPLASSDQSEGRFCLLFMFFKAKHSHTALRSGGDNSRF
jgi:hypothetical protein